MAGQPYAVRSPHRRRKVLDTLREHAEDTVWDVLDAAADPWGFRQWNADDSEGEDVRDASVGRLSLTYRVNRPLRRLPGRRRRTSPRVLRESAVSWLPEISIRRCQQGRCSGAKGLPWP